MGKNKEDKQELEGIKTSAHPDDDNFKLYCYLEKLEDFHGNEEVRKSCQKLYLKEKED